jgi:hypothetical protein
MENKDLSKLFQQAAETKPERPSGKTWRKLERRLDRHERWQIKLQRFSTQMVAILLLFVAIIGPVTINLHLDEQRRQAELNRHAATLEIISPQDSVPGLRKFLLLNVQ